MNNKYVLPTVDIVKLVASQSYGTARALINVFKPFVALVFSLVHAPLSKLRLLMCPWLALQ